MNDTPKIDNAALNRFLAEKVMGWKLETHGKDQHELYRQTDGQLLAAHWWNPIDNPKKAFEVLEKWCDGGKVGCWMMTGHQAQGRHGDWQHFRVHLYRDADECEGPSVTAVGPTLPLAICRAVYAAVAAPAAERKEP